MRALQWKEWRLSMSPVPLLFLLLSGLILIPNYPYYVTFFYNGLGIFMLMQSLRENRDTAYLMLLPVTKAEMVCARFRTVVQLELLQALACVPFMALRASYGQLNNAVGIEANTAFLGLGLVQMGLFNLVFFPMHYKNAYDLGKPFVAAPALAAISPSPVESMMIFAKIACRPDLFSMMTPDSRPESMIGSQTKV